MDQLSLRIDNNQREIYDLSRTLRDYMEMQDEFANFAEYREKGLGLSAQIPTRWAVFLKAIKVKYLQLKKILAFRK